MADSLRDQLLKSGLVQKLKPESKPERAPQKPQHARHANSAQAGLAQQKQYAPRPAQQKQGHKPGQTHATHKPARSQEEMDLARAYALRAQQERRDHEREQREAEQRAREKKERKQKLLTLLDGKALNTIDADVPRHFPHGNKIRRVYCTPEQLARLNRGELAVVQLAGRYLLVERDVALQAQAIQDETMVLLCDPNAPAEDDVPADLVW